MKLFNQVVQKDISIVISPTIFCLFLGQAIGQIQRLMQVCILCFLNFDLILNNNVKQLDVFINTINFSSVRILEI